MHVMKTLMLWLLPVILLCSFCSVAFWIFLSNNNVNPNPSSKIHQKGSDTQSCKGCKESVFIAKALGNYSNGWKKHEANFKRFRSLLSGKCHAVSKAVVTQSNTPLGSNVIYDGERRKPLQVTQALFSILAKEQPFGNATRESCAVVGNGGILTNSSCGEEINSAQFVIRCNLPPLDKRFEKDVGNKTNLVTANPSILHENSTGNKPRQETIGCTDRSCLTSQLRILPDCKWQLPAIAKHTATANVERTLWENEGYIYTRTNE